MKTKSQKIRRVNKLLVQYFGVPPRAEELPDPLNLLVATILSQNTNDRNSFKAFQNLREKFSTWELVYNSEQKDLENTIRTAGLAKQKASAIKNLLSELQLRRTSLSLDFVKELPDVEIMRELTAMKGIGVKTASCVLLFALGRNVCPVDTHVHRTVNRIGIVKSSQRDKTFEQLNQDFPDGIAHQFHTNLIRLGREICKPQNPACSECPVLSECSFETKNMENNKKGRSEAFMLLDSV